MKVGILTFHIAINYGAVLQAYGLQEYLKKLGHEVYIIDYRPDYLLAPYKTFQWKKKLHQSMALIVKDWIRECLVMPIRLKRKWKFSRFVGAYLNLHSWNMDLNLFDAFVFGSDQIWNPEITQQLDGIFCGRFSEAQGKIKIAYAASAGSVKNLTDDDYSLLNLWLKDFDRISVREKSLAEKLEIDHVSVAIDPALLAGREHFEPIACRNDEKKPYLLLFTLGRDEYAIGEAQKIANKKNLRIVEIVSSKESINNPHIKQSLSPEEFLGYIKNAAYVVTTSYHGMVFSILFQKNFNVISEGSKVGERAKELLGTLKLVHRLVVHKEGIEADTSDIDYEGVNTELLEFRKQSGERIFDRLNQNPRKDTKTGFTCFTGR